MTQPDPPRTDCLFCGQTLLGNRSKEHVLPQWLLDHLGVRSTSVSPTHFGNEGQVRSTRKHSLESLQEGRVCATCNNGWMSSLEATTLPMLKELFALQRGVTQLTSSERFQLARWAAKTVFCLNSASNFAQHVPSAHYRQLLEQPMALPDNLLVVAQQHHGTEPFYWLQGAVWNASGTDLSDFEVLAKETYKVTLQLGKLLLLVAWWPHPGWHFVLWKGVHVPLWPQRGPMGFFSRDGFPFQDSLEATGAFHGGLMLAEASTLR